MLLQADLVVPMSCSVHVSVYDVAVTMDLLQGGDVSATPNPQPGGQCCIRLASRPAPNLGGQCCIRLASRPTPNLGGKCCIRLASRPTPNLGSRWCIRLASRPTPKLGGQVLYSSGLTPNPQAGGPGAVFVWAFTWNLPSKVGPNRDRVKNHG